MDAFRGSKMHNDLHDKLVVHITGQVSIVDHWGLNSEDLIRDPGEAVFNIQLQPAQGVGSSQRKKGHAGAHLESVLGLALKWCASAAVLLHWLDCKGG